MIVSAFARRLVQLGAKNEILMAPATVNIIVLKKSGCWQHHIRHECRLGHELLVHTDKEIVTRESPLDLALIGRNRNWIGVLDNERMNGTAALQPITLTRQDGTNTRLI